MKDLRRVGWTHSAVLGTALLLALPSLAVPTAVTSADLPLCDASGLSIRPLTPTVGAEIAGLDLRRPLSHEQVDAIEEALLAHGVVFFRDQDITPEQQLAFARQMGPVSIPPFAPRYGSDPELVVLDQVLPKGEGADEWHSDNTFMAEPPMGSILKAVQLPTYGGDTCFASMVAAYDGLSSAMKRLPPRENDVLLRFLIGVPVPLPLGPPFDRVLGQPLGAALRGARLRGAPRDAPRHAGARASDGSARQLKEATVKPSSVSAGVSTRAGACAETTGRRSPGTGRQPEGESLRQRTTWGSATNTALASAPAR